MEPMFLPVVAALIAACSGLVLMRRAETDARPLLGFLIGVGLLLLNVTVAAFVVELELRSGAGTLEVGAFAATWLHLFVIVVLAVDGIRLTLDTFCGTGYMPVWLAAIGGAVAFAALSTASYLATFFALHRSWP